VIYQRLQAILIFMGACLLLFSFHGCATAPRLKEPFRTVTLHGVTYYPLAALCEQRTIALEYDTITQRIMLERDTHHAAARVGDTLVLSDGRPVTLKDPVDLSDGAIVVPESFRAQVIDQLFKGTVALTTKLCPLPRFKKIAIDAGHGGKDPGAIGRGGHEEKEINLDIAKRLAKILTQNGVDIVMTRSTDVFIPLPERHEIANNAGADLFVSVHSNASRTRSMNGFEVYYVCPSVNDQLRAEAVGGRVPPGLDTASLGGDSAVLNKTLWDMRFSSCRAESIALSRSVCVSAEHILGVKILGVKPARFEVLKGARMPAVLVEVGFISHVSEAKKLNNGFYRQQIAQAIAEGILGYAHDVTLAEN